MTTMTKETGIYRGEEKSLFPRYDLVHFEIHGEIEKVYVQARLVRFFQKDEAYDLFLHYKTLIVFRFREESQLPSRTHSNYGRKAWEPQCPACHAQLLQTQNAFFCPQCQQILPLSAVKKDICPNCRCLMDRTPYRAYCQWCGITKTIEKNTEVEIES